MLHPKINGIIVSATKMNFGRIIPVLDSGYDRDNMLIVRPGETDIDGVKCIDGLSSTGKQARSIHCCRRC